jgi:uncharacterized damage-inducible protein DinB
VDADSLLVLVRCHTWANDRVLSSAAELSDEELKRPGGFDHESAFQTLRHLLDSDWSWREYLVRRVPAQRTVWDEFPLDDLQSLRAFFAEEGVRLETYVASLEEASVNEMVPIGPRTDGSDEVRPRWFILAHVIGHGTHHRSEVARYLTERGHSPGDLDMLFALERWPWHSNPSRARPT